MTHLVDRTVGIFRGSLWASAAVAGVLALSMACGGKGKSGPPPSMNDISGPWGVELGDNRIAMVVLPDGSFRSLAVVIAPDSTVPPNMTMNSGSIKLSGSAITGSAATFTPSLPGASGAAGNVTLTGTANSAQSLSLTTTMGGTAYSWTFGRLKGTQTQAALSDLQGSYAATKTLASFNQDPLTAPKVALSVDAQGNITGTAMNSQGNLLGSLAGTLVQANAGINTYTVTLSYTPAGQNATPIQYTGGAYYSVGDDLTVLVMATDNGSTQFSGIFAKD